MSPESAHGLERIRIDLGFKCQSRKQKDDCIARIGNILRSEGIEIDNKQIAGGDKCLIRP